MKRSPMLWFAASTLACAALTVGADARAGGCTTDADCKGGRVCVAGECANPPAAGCGTDKDCPGDQVCEQGVCGAMTTSVTPVTPPPAPPPGGPPPNGGPPPGYPVPPPGYGPQPGAGGPPPGYPVPPPGYGNPAYGPAAVGYSEPLPPEPPTEYNSTGLMVTGAILLPVGFLAAMAGGIGLGVIAANNGGDVPSRSAGVAAVPIVGGVFAITGIIFLSIGAPKVAVSPDEPVTAELSPTIEPMIGPGSFGVRGAF